MTKKMTNGNFKTVFRSQKIKIAKKEIVIDKKKAILNGVFIFILEVYLEIKQNYKLYIKFISDSFYSPYMFGTYFFSYFTNMYINCSITNKRVIPNFRNNFISRKNFAR